MIRNVIWFDDYIRTRNGKVKPFWDFTVVEHDISDGELAWFHEGYGRMKLYRLLQVDKTSEFIAEDLNISCRTSDPRWAEWSEKPELALA